MSAPAYPAPQQRPPVEPAPTGLPDVLRLPVPGRCEPVPTEDTGRSSREPFTARCLPVSAPWLTPVKALDQRAVTREEFADMMEGGPGTVSSTPIFEDLCREHAAAGKAYPSVTPPDRSDERQSVAEPAPVKADADGQPAWVSPNQRVA